MKLRTKLLAAPIITAAVALGAGVTHGVLTQVAHDADRVQQLQDIDQFKIVGSVQAQIGEVHAGVFRLMALSSAIDDKQVKAHLANATDQVEGLQRVLSGLAPEGGDAELLASAGAMAPLLDKYGKQIRKAVELTSVDAAMGVAAMKAAEQTHAEIAKGMSAIMARTEAIHSARDEASDQQARRSAALFGLLGLLATVAAVAGAFVMQRRLVDDLGRAVAISRDVAMGKLDTEARSDRVDEIGDLIRALGHMVGQLRDSLLTVQQATSSIGVASSEIAAGNIDLSQRTELTSSNLQSTASSMSQLTSTVRQSADAASQANQLAASAATVAQRGGQVVSQVVSTMDEINASSRKIGDIIGTIDGIAFQTNILALNAAVEAARAGEQGRGFAVVAGEVRSLAQRSAEAAREIKALIGASVDRVEAGTKLVRDAGGTMDEIVASVQRVSDIIAEISAASAEQSSGIGSVNASVTQLDQMTQQNAALVEESAAAAESLKEQSTRLAQVLHRFELGQSARSPDAAPAAAPVAAQAKAQAASVVARASQAAKSVVSTAPARAKVVAAAPAAAPAAATSTASDDWETF